MDALKKVELRILGPAVIVEIETQDGRALGQHLFGVMSERREEAIERIVSSLLPIAMSDCRLSKASNAIERTIIGATRAERVHVGQADEMFRKLNIESLFEDETLGDVVVPIWTMRKRV